MGRPEKPISLHNLQGTTPEGRSAVGGESVHAPGRPKWGKLPRQCRATFKRICKLLADRKHLTPGDRELVTLYAIAEDRYWQFKNTLDVEGPTIQTEEGPKDHPAWKHFYSAERTMLSCLDRLGLNPLARDKAKQTRTGKEKSPDEFEQFIESGRGPSVVPFRAPEMPDIEPEGGGDVG